MIKTDTLADYSLLWGGEPQQMTRDELVEHWKALVPGFDATRHLLTNVEVNVNIEGYHALVSGLREMIRLDPAAWAIRA